MQLCYSCYMVMPCMDYQPEQTGSAVMTIDAVRIIVGRIEGNTNDGNSHHLSQFHLSHKRKEQSPDSSALSTCCGFAWDRPSTSSLD